METRRRVLLTRLQDPDPGVRTAAARALDRLDALEALPAVLGNLREKRREEWVGLLRSLEGLRDETCLKFALQALAHPAVDVRLAALDLASDFRDWRATAHLARLLGDESPLVRARAAEVLGALGDRRAAAQVAPLLDDPEPQVQAGAAAALGHLGHAPSAPALTALASHPDPGVRAAAVEALGRLAFTNRS
ncbi:MAG: HEAT repeat domain-containing protein [Thermodesulfobacteriota bacterium]